MVLLQALIINSILKATQKGTSTIVQYNTVI